jgi:exonuclease III
MYFLGILSLLTVSLFNYGKPSDTDCLLAAYPKEDRRTNTTELRIVQYNAEWLFIDYFSTSHCPGYGCTWVNDSEAEIHLSYVSNIINELNPDIINICEVEGCDELNLLIKNMNNYQYSPYLIKGKDTATGQNVGILSKIDPDVNLHRDESRVTYPIPDSHCNYTGAESTTGVSKHYITEFTINKIPIAMIGAHLLAFPTDKTRCAEREAQAQVLQNIIISYVNKNYEIIMIGDFNDFDEDPLDRNNNNPISQVLDILKGLKGIHQFEYELFNIAQNINKEDRYTDWYDSNNDCVSTMNEFSTIDHILVSEKLMNKVVNAFVYHNYSEFCGKYNSDHYPVVIDLIM